MPFNLLLLPLLGGYVFVRCWNFTKFYIIRSDKERLLIASALAGVVLLFTTYFLNIVFSYLIPCKSGGLCVPTLWNQWIPIEYSGISFGTFFLGVTVCHIFNVFCSEKKQIDRVIERDADPLELLLKRSQEEKIPVSITLDTGKVYVGRVAHQFNPGTATNNISLLPLKSGHRDSDTQQMYLTLDYQQTYQNIKTEADRIIDEVTVLPVSQSAQARELVRQWQELKDISNRFVLVIPVNQIVSANLFDSDLHTKYFKITRLPLPLGEPVE